MMMMNCTDVTGPFSALRHCHTEMTTFDMSTTSAVILNEKRYHIGRHQHHHIFFVIILNENDSLNLGATSRLMTSVRLVLMTVF